MAVMRSVKSAKSNFHIQDSCVQIIPDSNDLSIKYGFLQNVTIAISIIFDQYIWFLFHS